MIDLMNGESRIQKDVLDKGFVALVDCMPRLVEEGQTADSAIVQAARVSYGAGTKTSRRDEALIRYLVKHKHSSPLEMVVLKFHIKAPIMVARQTHRHRMFCLAGNVPLHFDLPGGIKRRGTQLYKLTVKQIFDKFQPTQGHIGNPLFKKNRVTQMRLRCLNEETGNVEHTNIVDIWESGEKPVYKVTTESGAWATMSIDHRCLTQNGWKRLEEVTTKIPDEKFPFSLHPKEDCKILVIRKGKGTGVTASFNEIDEETEEWKPVVNWEDYYIVSNQGRVKRIAGGQGCRLHGKPKKITVVESHGIVSLNRPGKQETAHVHKLVLESFVGEKPEGQECLHIDGNGLNNKIENLRWGSSKENSQDQIRHGATVRLIAYPEKVVNIERLETQMTYDIEVSGPHNFSANGLVVHNSLNELSGRYSVMKEEFYRPDSVRAQSSSNKQGSEGVVPDAAAEEFYEYLDLAESVHKKYTELVDQGVSREQARMGLPLNLYTEWYLRADLRNLLHFLKLRMDPHTQWETQQYANAIYELVEPLVPFTMKAFLDYEKNAVTLSQEELRAMLSGDMSKLSKREADELIKTMEDVVDNIMGEKDSLKKALQLIEKK